jgi:hypothetical protein
VGAGVQNYTVVLFLYCYYYLLFEANFPVGCFNLQSLLTLTVRKKPFRFFCKEKNAIAHSRPPIIVPETIPFERLIEDESIILFRHRVVCVETNANSRTVANVSVIQNPTHHPPSEPPDNIGPHEFCRRWRDSEQLQRQWTALATTT